MWWCYLPGTKLPGVKDRLNTQPTVTFFPPWNGGIFGTYRLMDLRVRSYVPTQASILILGTQGDMFIIRRTRKHFFSKKCSNWDSNSCPRRCHMWWCYLLSYRGKTSIDYPTQGKPYNRGESRHSPAPTLVSCDFSKLLLLLLYYTRYCITVQPNSVLLLDYYIITR